MAHHGATDVARHAPRHGHDPLHMPLRPRVEGRDTGHSAGIDEVMENLKHGNILPLSIATDDALVSSRSLYKQWATDEHNRLKAEYALCHDAIVAELARRGLTGG